jgi:hypothetical protein
MEQAVDRGGVEAERQECPERAQAGKTGGPEQDAADRIPFEFGLVRQAGIGGWHVGSDRPAKQDEMAEPPGGQRDDDGEGKAVRDAEDRRQ